MDVSGAGIADRLRGHLETREAFRGASLLLAQVAGSHAFNVAVESSDEDLFGVWTAGIEEILLGERKSSLSSHDPDFETHELETFLLLLEKGNPKVIEPLFTDRLIWKSDEISSLLAAAKQCCLSQHTLMQYRHYAKSQKGDADETPPKKRYHSLRLAMEGARIAQGLEPLVYLEGETRELIMDFRRGKGTEAQFRQLFDKHIAETKREDIPLPDKTDVDVLEPLLIEFRRRKMSEKLGSFEEAFASAEQPSSENPLVRWCRASLEAAGLGKCPILAACKSGSALFLGDGDVKVDDVLGVFCAPLENVLGFARNRIMRVEDGKVIRQPECKNSINSRGVILLEAGFFCSLLASGNHRALEMVAMDSPGRFLSPWFDSIVSRSALFIGKQPIEHAFGMVKSAQKSGRPKLIVKFIAYCEKMGQNSEFGIGADDLALMRRIEDSDLDILASRIEALEKRKSMPGYQNMQQGRDWIRNHLLKLRFGQEK